MYKCEHFVIWELVPPEMKRFPENKLWLLFDNRILRVIDLLRDFYGKIIINDWFFGGDNIDSGIRTPLSKYFSPTSQHSYGRALDPKPQETPVEKIRRDIISQKFPWMEKIKGLELEVSWLHIDTRNSKSLVTFVP